MKRNQRAGYLVAAAILLVVLGGLGAVLILTSVTGDEPDAVACVENFLTAMAADNPEVAARFCSDPASAGVRHALNAHPEWWGTKWQMNAVEAMDVHDGSVGFASVTVTGRDGVKRDFHATLRRRETMTIEWIFNHQAREPVFPSLPHLRPGGGPSFVIAERKDPALQDGRRVIALRIHARGLSGDSAAEAGRVKFRVEARILTKDGAETMPSRKLLEQEQDGADFQVIETSIALPGNLPAGFHVLELRLFDARTGVSDVQKAEFHLK